MRTEHDGEPVNWGMFGLWEVGNGNEQNKNIQKTEKLSCKTCGKKSMQVGTIFI